MTQIKSHTFVVNGGETTDMKYKPNTIKYKVIAKLQSEGLSLTSPWSEIETCLARTVSPGRCIEVARQLVANEQCPVNWKPTTEKPVRSGTGPLRLIKVCFSDRLEQMAWYNVETENVRNSDKIHAPTSLTDFDGWDYA